MAHIVDGRCAPADICLEQVARSSAGDYRQQLVEDKISIQASNIIGEKNIQGRRQIREVGEMSFPSFLVPPYLPTWQRAMNNNNSMLSLHIYFCLFVFSFCSTFPSISNKRSSSFQSQPEVNITGGSSPEINHNIETLSSSSWYIIRHCSFVDSAIFPESC